MNKLYPLEDGDNATIPNVDPATLVEEEEAFESYDDEDEAIDKYTEVVWENYCKKGERIMTKKVCQQFFKDALILIGYRKNKEPKVLLGAVKEKDALEHAFAYLSQGLLFFALVFFFFFRSSLFSQDGKTVTFEKWKDFVNMASLDEILKLLLQQQI